MYYDKLYKRSIKLSNFVSTQRQNLVDKIYCELIIWFDHDMTEKLYEINLISNHNTKNCEIFIDNFFIYCKGVAYTYHCFCIKHLIKYLNNITHIINEICEYFYIEIVNYHTYIFNNEFLNNLKKHIIQFIDNINEFSIVKYFNLFESIKPIYDKYLKIIDDKILNYQLIFYCEIKSHIYSKNYQQIITIFSKLDTLQINFEIQQKLLILLFENIKLDIISKTNNTMNWINIIIIIELLVDTKKFNCDKLISDLCANIYDNIIYNKINFQDLIDYFDSNPNFIWSEYLLPFIQIKNEELELKKKTELRFNIIFQQNKKEFETQQQLELEKQQQLELEKQQLESKLKVDSTKSTVKVFNDQTTNQSSNQTTIQPSNQTNDNEIIMKDDGTFTFTPWLTAKKKSDEYQVHHTFLRSSSNESSPLFFTISNLRLEQVTSTQRIHNFVTYLIAKLRIIDLKTKIETELPLLFNQTHKPIKIYENNIKHIVNEDSSQIYNNVIINTPPPPPYKNSYINFLIEKIELDNSITILPCCVSIHNIDLPDYTEPKLSIHLYSKRYPQVDNNIFSELDEPINYYNIRENASNEVRINIIDIIQIDENKFQFRYEADTGELISFNKDKNMLVHIFSKIMEIITQIINEHL